MVYMLLAFLCLLLLLVLYVAFGGPKLPRETDSIIEEVSKFDLSCMLKGEAGYAQSDNVKIWYECISPEGIPRGSILLNSSMGGDCLFWPPKFIQYLINENFQVIRFDQRGTGLSDWMDNWNSKTPYLLTDMAKDALAVLDELQIVKAHIVGLSLGGMVAQEIAIADPERIASLTLLSTSPNVADCQLQGMPSGYLFCSALKSLPILKYRIMGGEINLVKERIAKTISAYGYDGLDIKEIAKLTLYDLRERRGIHLKAIRQHIVAAASTRSRYELLRNISKPALIIHGTDDRVFPIAHGEKLFELIPNATKHWIEGAKHQFPYPNMQEVQSIIASHIIKASESD